MTRKEYIESSSPDAFNTYYDQLVSPASIHIVIRLIGKETLLASRDPDLNDIPLHRWDALASLMSTKQAFLRLDDYPTLSGLVCVAKRSAQIWIAGQKAATSA